MPGEGQHGDGPLARVAGEEGRALGLFGEQAAGVVEPFAHGEHRGRHVGAPGEARGGGHLAGAAHRAELHQARRRARWPPRSVPPRSGTPPSLRRPGRRCGSVSTGSVTSGSSETGSRLRRHAAEEHQRQHRGDGGDGAADGAEARDMRGVRVRASGVRTQARCTMGWSGGPCDP